MQSFGDFSKAAAIGVSDPVDKPYNLIPPDAVRCPRCNNHFLTSRQVKKWLVIDLIREAPALSESQGIKILNALFPEDNPILREIHKNGVGKICLRCKRNRPIQLFLKHCDLCFDCIKKELDYRPFQGIYGRRTESKLTCRRCGRVKPGCEFRKRNLVCSECDKDRARERARRKKLHT